MRPVRLRLGIRPLGNGYQIITNDPAATDAIVIEVSRDLRSWEEAGGLTPEAGELQMKGAAADHAARFYRAVPRPAADGAARVE